MPFLKINLNLQKILYRVDHEHIALGMVVNPNDVKNKDIPENEPAMHLKLIFKALEHTSIHILNLFVR